MVEDDPTTRNALRGILVRKGFEVIAVASLSEARPALESLPESVVLDLMLPDGDGVELLRAVRRANLPIRVVVTTGVVDVRRLVEVRSLDPDGLFSKPIDLPKLLAALGIDP